MRWRPSISWGKKGRLMGLPLNNQKMMMSCPKTISYSSYSKGSCGWVWILRGTKFVRIHGRLPTPNLLITCICWKNGTGIFWFRNPAGDSLQSWCLGDTWKDSWIWYFGGCFVLIFLFVCFDVKNKMRLPSFCNSNSRIKWYQMKKTYIDKASQDFPPRNKKKLCSRCYVSLWSKSDEPKWVDEYKGCLNQGVSLQSFNKMCILVAV